MVYLDSNVFVFALLAKDELGNAAYQILANLDKIDAKTSCLTFAEVAWAVSRVAGVQTAAQACRAILAFPNLEVASVTYGDVWEMTRKMDAFNLRPRVRCTSLS
ncbi:MAG: PIN domain-containing protein [Candidatus Hodarchaeaceae archaeon]|nr:PIN domain-containing protein [Candidatus Hodarchaeaceae archaeon]